ncbi:MAG: glycosyltransferase family 4 protein [Vicinamibacterales bacterium]
MRICHVTPHLPPDQAANALLPFHLGTWAAEAGHEVRFVAHPPRAGAAANLPGSAVWIPSHLQATRFLRATKLASCQELWRVTTHARAAVAWADVVHVHSNGLLAESSALLAGVLNKPVVLTLYGTEIWHYRAKPFDLFTRMLRRARLVTYYSRGLMDRARDFGLARPGAAVVYPPVAETFQWHDVASQMHLRRELGVEARHLLVNVKRLHPLASQKTLIDAMPAILAAHPDTQLFVCGTGPLRAELEAQSLARGVHTHVRFAGLVDNHLVAHYCAAADLFVLPSQLEACPTVAVEALASGTPVVSSDNPGGVELHELFGDDVEVVPRGDAGQLAAAVIERLAHKRRTRPSTAEVLAREFRPDVAWRRFLRIYQDAAGREHVRDNAA